MSSFTNATKQSLASFANTSRNTGTIYPYVKAGEGVPYDSPATYDAEFDPISGNPITYDASGTAPSYTNLAKS